MNLTVPFSTAPTAIQPYASFKLSVPFQMKKAVFYFMFFLSIAVAGYAFYAYFVLTPGSTVSPAMKTGYDAHNTRLLAHVFFAVGALITGPFQFMPSIRKHRSMHRTLGYAYFTSVFLSGAAGFALSFIAQGGLTSTLGFGSLAVLWIYSGYRALAAIRQKDYAAHETWVIRSFALTFAAVTLRIYLGVFSGLGFAIASFYPAISWLCWVPNILFVEWLLLPAKNRRAA